VKRSLAFVTLGLVALFASISAFAADPGTETKMLNAADQAAARAVVVKRADLEPTSGWQGGARKPGGLALTCPNFHPHLSQFVATGEAASYWKHVASPLQVGTETTVLQTSRMVRREWQIQVQAPAAIRCFHQTYAGAVAAAGGRFISFKRISFPQIAPYSAAFEVQASSPTFGRVVIQLVLVGRNRTEIALSVVGALSARRAVNSESLRLARLLVSRIQA
jgi:hypothetical protein